MICQVHHVPDTLVPAGASTPVRAPEPLSGDPRTVMAQRLPEALQPFLTWLTARSRSGDLIRERSPAFFVSVALLQTCGGMLLSTFALGLLPMQCAAALTIGLILATAGLGLFQVVIFHHCSHGTVFRGRNTNIIVGRAISSVLIFNHFDVYKAGHMLHHSNKKLLGEEDEFANFVFGLCGLRAGQPKQQLWLRILINLVSPAFHTRFLIRRIRAAWLSHDAGHNVLGIGVWLMMGIAETLTGHTVAFFVAVVLPVTVLLQVTTVLRILCEHRFPEAKMILARDRNFSAHATAGVFPGAMPPKMSWRSAAGLIQWLGWWANMLSVQLCVRLLVLVGDAPCHDWHHRRPASRKWTSYSQARQQDLDAGLPGSCSFSQESWGLFRAIDDNLASLARTPQGIVG